MNSSSPAKSPSPGSWNTAQRVSALLGVGEADAPSVVVLTKTVGEGPSSAERIRRGSGADCVGRGGELLAEDEEQSAELGALRLGEARDAEELCVVAPELWK